MNQLKCPRCDEPKPETEFYVSRSRESGRTVFCKPHHREQVKRYRQSEGYKRKQEQRKPCVKSIPVWRLEISAREKVLMCYRKGITDRHEIKRNTRIGWDELCDIICELANERLIKFDRQKQHYRAA